MAGTLAGAVALAADADLSKDPLWPVAIVVEVCSTLLGTVGKQSWRLAALAAPGSGGVCISLCQHPTARNLYILGSILTIMEPPLDAYSMSLAPVSIVSACAGLSVIWNIVLAPCLLGERLTVVRLAASAVIVVGTILTGVFGPHYEVEYSAAEYLALLTSTASVSYYAVLAFALAVLFCLMRRFPADRVFPAIFAGCLAGNQFLLKATIALFNCGAGPTDKGDCGGNPFAFWPVYAVGFLALAVSIGGLFVLAVTLRDSEALDSVVIYQGSVVFVGAVSSAAVLQEQATNDTASIVGYCLSLAAIVAALAVLALRESSSLSSPVHDAPVSWQWYDRTAAAMHKRVNALVVGGGKLPLGDDETGSKSGAKPSEASRLLKSGVG